MSEEELTLQMGSKAEGYEENMKEQINQYGDMDYNYTPVSQEELQEYAEEPITSSDTQDNEIQEVQVQSTLDSISEPQNYNLSELLPYIGLFFTLTFLFFVIKETIKAFIWSRFFK